jgi:hypothetical protein
MIRQPNDPRRDPRAATDVHPGDLGRTADHQPDIDRQAMFVAVPDQVLKRAASSR